MLSNLALHFEGILRAEANSWNVCSCTHFCTHLFHVTYRVYLFIVHVCMRVLIQPFRIWAEHLRTKAAAKQP